MQYWLPVYPWILGLISFFALPLMLWVGAAVTTGTVNRALLSVHFLYFAGTMGGLALELLRGRGRMELPSRNPRALPGAPAPAPNTPSDDDFGPYGPRPDTGFFARLTIGGLAAAAVMILLKLLVDDAPRSTLAFELKQVDTLAWAVLIGAASPAVWKASQALVDSRLATLNGKFSDVGSAVGQAEETLQGALATAKANLPTTPPAGGTDEARAMENTADVLVALGQSLGEVTAARAILE